MSISLFKIYRQSCIDLARSIVIKDTLTAIAMNEKDREDEKLYKSLGEPGYYDPEDPHTWRYYKHLAGVYHRKDYITVTDELTGKQTIKPAIQVRSIDTTEMIDFTRENLAEHRATLREYQKGTTYYLNLIEKFPEHITLIDGILNPIDMDKAINAREHEILRYNDKYVEENEYSLIERIQAWIDRYYNRWDNNDYIITDDLYVPARIAILYTFLPSVIMNLRYDSSRSIEAHSFHVWNYLGSHQWLDEYRNHLDLYQRMWFYRNIRWSEINAGKTDTFMEHIRVVMTERNLPISKFDTHQLPNEMRNDPNTLYPDANFKRTPLNLPGTFTKADEYKSIENMLDSEIKEARDNHRYLEDDKMITRKKLTRSVSNALPTKILESIVVDNSKRAAIKQDDVDLNEWIYMTTKGLYTAHITVANPSTAKFMSFNQHEALIAYIYCALRSYLPKNEKGEDIKPELIPCISVNDVLRVKKPKLSDVRKLMDSGFTDYTYLYAIDNTVFEPSKIISTEKFRQFLDEVYVVRNKLRNIYSFTRDYREHAQVKSMTYKYLETVMCALTDKPTRFEDYFKSKGWDIYNLSRAECIKLGNDITKYALGKDFITQYDIKELQGMMVRLLKKLSSYSIHFLTKVNEESTSVVDWAYMRLHGLGIKGDNKDWVDLTCIDAFNLTCKSYHQHSDTILSDAINVNEMFVTSYHKDSFNYINDWKSLGRTVQRTSLRMPSVSWKYIGEQVKSNTIKPKENPNPWNMDKFRIHATTEDRSKAIVDEEGNLIVRGVVYVDKDYRGK